MNKLLPMFSLTVILLLLCGSCSGEQWKSVNEWLLVSQTTVYGELEVTEQWQEVKLLKPLNSEGPLHYIVLELKDEDQWQFFDLKEIKNSQGQLVSIAVQLIDESGLAYELIPNLYNRGSVKFSPNFVNGSGGEKVPLPILGKADKNVNFVKLRIKTNHPFTCTKILWQRYNFK
jgi:hypothetical protein